MPALMERIHHTAAIAVWGNHGPTIVHWEESAQSVTANLRLGDVMPMLASATGRCFAAWLPREVTAPLLEPEVDKARRIQRKDRSEEHTSELQSPDHLVCRLLLE